MLLALVTLLLASGAAFVAAGVLGAASGATLTLTLALPPLVAAPADVPRTTAGVLAIGYSSVWLILLAAGAAWDAFHQPATGLLPIALGGVVVLLLAPRLLVATAVPTAVRPCQPRGPPSPSSGSAARCHPELARSAHQPKRRDDGVGRAAAGSCLTWR